MSRHDFGAELTGKPDTPKNHQQMAIRVETITEEQWGSCLGSCQGRSAQTGEGG